MAIQTSDSPNLAMYQEWEQRAGPGMRARYVDFAPRAPLFEVRADDIPHILPGYQLQRARPDGLVTVSMPGGGSVTVRGLSDTTLSSALAVIDGKASVAEIAQVANAHWPVAAWQQLLQALLGTAIDVPAVFAALSATIARTEIVRFPEQRAHAVLRTYWENAAAVRRVLPEFYRALDRTETFRMALSRLHVLATVGHNNQSFYGGFGFIPTVPGGYREIGVQTAIPASLVHTLDRWSATLGAGHVARDAQMMTPSGQTMNFVREAGEVVVHPATGSALIELLDEARVALEHARKAAATAHAGEALYNLAVFHQILANAHPFSNINNSIAMNIVNACLNEWGLGHLPHLLLDYLAQRLTPDQYTGAFAAAVRRHALADGDPAVRGRALAASGALYSCYRADRDGTFVAG